MAKFLWQKHEPTDRNEIIWPQWNSLKTNQWQILSSQFSLSRQLSPLSNGIPAGCHGTLMPSSDRTVDGNSHRLLLLLLSPHTSEAFSLRKKKTKTCELLNLSIGLLITVHYFKQKIRNRNQKYHHIMVL